MFIFQINSPNFIELFFYHEIMITKYVLNDIQSCFKINLGIKTEKLRYSIEVDEGINQQLLRGIYHFY